MGDGMGGNWMGKAWIQEIINESYWYHLFDKSKMRLCIHTAI